MSSEFRFLAARRFFWEVYVESRSDRKFRPPYFDRLNPTSHGSESHSRVVS